jgi:hypothetical protein
MRAFRLLLLGAAVAVAPACSSAPKPVPGPSEPVASPAAANEKLGGTWLLSIERGGNSTDHSLHLQLTAGELAGSLTGPDGNSREVSQVALAGDKVTWEIAGQNGMAQRFEGKLTGASSMEGSIKLVRTQKGSGKGGGGQRGGGSGGSSGSDSGDSSGSSSGDGTAASDGGGSTSGGSGSSGRGGRGGRGRGGRSGGSGTTVTWKAYKTVELPAVPEPAPAKPGL